MVFQILIKSHPRKWVAFFCRETANVNREIENQHLTSFDSIAPSLRSGPATGNAFLTYYSLLATRFSLSILSTYRPHQPYQLFNPFN
jgi:hypothetical protein